MKRVGRRNVFFYLALDLLETSAKLAWYKIRGGKKKERKEVNTGCEKPARLDETLEEV